MRKKKERKYIRTEKKRREKNMKLYWDRTTKEDSSWPNLEELWGAEYTYFITTNSAIHWEKEKPDPLDGWRQNTKSNWWFNPGDIESLARANLAVKMCYRWGGKGSKLMVDIEHPYSPADIDSLKELEPWYDQARKTVKFGGNDIEIWSYIPTSFPYHSIPDRTQRERYRQMNSNVLDTYGQHLDGLIFSEYMSPDLNGNEERAISVWAHHLEAMIVEMNRIPIKTMVYFAITHRGDNGFIPIEAARIAGSIFGSNDIDVCVFDWQGKYNEEIFGAFAKEYLD